MTSWQTGKKISQMYAGRKGRRYGKHQAASKPTDAERRRLIQFFICGSIFVLLVAAKFLLPAKIQQLGGPMGQLLERNMDVTEVFSTVGRVFAGEEDGWSDLYRSVFHPEEEPAVEAGADASPSAMPTAKMTPNAAPSAGSQPEENSDAPAISSENNAQPAPSPAPADPEPENTNVSAQQLTYILYSDKTLPDNVSMEQQVLGFDYCTPVIGTMSSNFGYRAHPVEGDEKFHYGVDIAADEGTDIGCFASGTVTAVGESSSYGKYLTVAHAGGFSSLYAHCSKITVSSGASVNAGQKIAEVGQTGGATGPHLHFEIHAGATFLDPVYYVTTK